MKLFLVVLLASAALVSAGAGVVQYEPQVWDEAAHSGDVHPYALAYKMPLPEYNGQTPSSSAEEFESFIDMQTHVRAESPTAARFTVTPALVETAESAAAAEDITWVNGYSLSKDEAAMHDPAGTMIEKVYPQSVPFDTLGETPKGLEFRRAVYGLRRRRMPYMQSPMMSLNPFRHPNGFFRTPHDMLEPRVFPASAAALNPLMTDFGAAKNNGGRPTTPGANPGKGPQTQQTQTQTTEQTQSTEQQTQEGQNQQQEQEGLLQAAKKDPLAVETAVPGIGAAHAAPGAIVDVLAAETTAQGSLSNPMNTMARFKRHQMYQEGKGGEALPQSFQGLRQLNDVLHAANPPQLASMNPQFGNSHVYNSVPGVQGDGFNPSMGPTAGFSGMSGVNAFSNVGINGHFNPDFTGMGQWAGVTQGDLRLNPLGHYSDGTGVYHPLGSGPSPFIPGMSAFWDWYNPRGGSISTTPDAGVSAQNK